MKENKLIGSKKIAEFLKEDSSLIEKKNNTQLTAIQLGDDYSVEEAYEEYERVLERNPGITPKGLMEFLKEDPTLTEEMTIDQLEETKGSTRELIKKEEK